jgi:hypothetical protein
VKSFWYRSNVSPRARSLLSLGTVLALLMVVLLACAAGWIAWNWIDGAALPAGKDRAAAQLDVVKIVASIAAGGGALVALYLAARRQRTQELELTHTEHDAAARRITDLYGQAADQLGSGKAPVRLAGLYALERLAQDNRDLALRQTVVNVICAYLRMPFTLPVGPPDSTADESPQARYDELRQERQVRLTAQRVLRAHLNPGPDYRRPAAAFWSDTDLDLSDAILIDFDLKHCRIREARFDRASFVGRTDFSKTEFCGKVLSFVDVSFLGDTDFSNASYRLSAPLDPMEAFFLDADFRRARFAGWVSFREMTSENGFDLSASSITHSLREVGVSSAARCLRHRSSWPDGWHSADNHEPIDDLEGTWHRIGQTGAPGFPRGSKRSRGCV